MSALPPWYDRWLAAALGESLAAEPRATCSACAMVATATSGPVENGFDASTKCCTFHPYLSSFNIGGILAHGEPAAAEIIKARIARGPGVTPLGIAVPAIYRTVYNEGVKQPHLFGRVPQLRCPFYVQAGGLCGIHRHRDAVCSTWFCKLEHGARGKLMWNTVRRLLQHIERALRLWCVQRLDIGGAAVELALTTDPFNKPLDEHDLTNTRDEALHRRSWGRYHGREREFYLACATAVESLEWPEVQALIGVEGQMLVQVLERMQKELDQLPGEVMQSPAGLVQLSPRPGQARLRHRSVPHDFADVPAAPLASLARLTARPLTDALAELRLEGIAVDEALVRTLLDYEVLVGSGD
jgi:hypothetical protein